MIIKLIKYKLSYKFDRIAVITATTQMSGWYGNHIDGCEGRGSGSGRGR